MEPDGTPRPADPAFGQLARGFDQWRAVQQAFSENMARLFAPAPEQLRAFQELVAQLAPPREELRRVLDLVKARRAQLETVSRQLDEIEDAVTRFAALADAIDERSSAFSSMFLPGTPPPGGRDPA